MMKNIVKSQPLVQRFNIYTYLLFKGGNGTHQAPGIPSRPRREDPKSHEVVGGSTSFQLRLRSRRERPHPPQVLQGALGAFRFPGRRDAGSVCEYSTSVL